MSWEPLPGHEAKLNDLASSLDRLSVTMGFARPDTVQLLERHWSALLGPDLAAQCRLEALRGTEMIVGVTDPAVAEHLRWSSRDLCAAVNAICDGEVIDEVSVRVRRELH